MQFGDFFQHAWQKGNSFDRIPSFFDLLYAHKIITCTLGRHRLEQLPPKRRHGGGPFKFPF